MPPEERDVEVKWLLLIIFHCASCDQKPVVFGHYETQELCKTAADHVAELMITEKTVDKIDVACTVVPTSTVDDGGQDI